MVPDDFLAKRIQILQDLAGASKIALLVNPGNQMHRLILAEQLARTARNLGVALLIVEATTPEEIDAAFASAAAQHADAIVDVGDTLTILQAPRVISARSEVSSAGKLFVPVIRQSAAIDRLRPGFSRSVPPYSRLRR